MNYFCALLIFDHFDFIKTFSSMVPDMGNTTEGGIDIDFLVVLTSTINMVLAFFE